MKLKPFILLTPLLALWSAPAIADWVPGESYKMHYPQLPDPNGWDVSLSGPVTVADDWLCTSSGPVADIHFWYSWKQDLPGQIYQVTATIWSDVPADLLNPASYSHPGIPLWTSVFDPGQFTIAGPEVGFQGWYDPWLPETNFGDHLLYYQLNIENILAPFEQQEGTIYWLGLNVTSDVGLMAGWKTSLDHFNDTAVWGDPFIGDWQELSDPIAGQPLDMAFVVTQVPEPGTMVMLISLGLVCLVVYARHRRLWLRVVA